MTVSNVTALGRLVSVGNLFAYRGQVDGVQITIGSPTELTLQDAAYALIAAAEASS